MLALHVPPLAFMVKIGSPCGTSIGRHWALRLARSAVATFRVVHASQPVPAASERVPRATSASQPNAHEVTMPRETNATKGAGRGGLLDASMFVVRSENE